MSVKPILFNGEMVRAILSGNKTQTCRPVKEPEDWEINSYVCSTDDGTRDHIFDVNCPQGHFTACLPAQYAEGDILYVREAWREWIEDDAECGCGGDFCTCPSKPLTPACYRADYDKISIEDLKEEGITFKPSIHMPKKYSRIFLKITNVYAVEVKTIDGAFAGRDGFRSSADFKLFWKDAYGTKTEWPPRFAWVYEFESCEKPENF